MKNTVNKILFILTKKEKRCIAGLLVLMILGGFLEMVGVAGIFPLMNLITSGETVYAKNVMEMAIVLMLIYLGKNCFLFMMYQAIYQFVYRGRSKLATRLFRVYMEEPYGFHLNRNVAIIQRAVRSDVDGFYNLVKALLQMLSELIICFVLSILLFMTDFQMAAMMVLLLGLCVGTVFVISKKKVKRLGEEDMKYTAGMNQWLLQGIGGIKEIKLLRREDYFAKQFEENSQKSSENQKKQQLLVQTPRLLTETVSIGAVLLWIAWASIRQMDLMQLIPTLAVFAVAAFRLLPSVGKINGLLAEYHFYKARADFIYEDLQAVEEQIKIENMQKEGCKAEEPSPLRFCKALEISKLSFGYPGSSRRILDEVSLSIAQGESVGIVGPSGAGKTTFVDLLLGLLRPQEGDICVDQVSIYERPNAWYQLLGYVPQSIYLADDTIKKNIAFGIPEEEIDSARVIEVIEQAQLLEVVNGLEQGMDTLIGDRGIRLSGGQRQRIGIARALYHRPRLLVLDEATSSLDTETEEAVMQAIEALHGKITMLVVAHRISTLRSCDHVYRVCDGKIVKE